MNRSPKSVIRGLVASRWRKAVLAAVVLTAAASTVIAVVGRDEASAGDPAKQADAPAVSPVSFYRDARLALAPLINHVRDLPAALKELAEQREPVSPTGRSSLVAEARRWTSDMATARDLVSRLAPRTEATVRQAADLYVTAAMLQGEAAQSVVAAATTPVATRMRSLASAGLRYYRLGDRLFDSGFRLLNAEKALNASELIFPPSVPDVSGRPVPQHPAEQPVSAWSSKHQPDIDAILALARTFPRRSAGHSSVVLNRLATQLDAAQAKLGASVPDSTAAQEAVVGLRLGVLVLGEAARAMAEPDGESRTARLHLIGERLWDGAIASLPAGISAANSQLPPSGYPVRLVFRGGVFDGRPPALRTGEGPLAGVPGGVPPLNPALLTSGG